MAYQNRYPCFICNQVLPLRQLSRINREADILVREIAITRRDERNLPAIEINDGTRLCINCSRSIRMEIRTMEEDPNFPRYKVLRQRSSHVCFICHTENNLTRLTPRSRIEVFVEVDVYIPSFTKSCPIHLTQDQLILPQLMPTLNFINRPYKIPDHDVQLFLQGLKTKVNMGRDFRDENEFTNEELQCLTSVNKNQFHELLAYCDPVPENNYLRHIYKKDLITFLCKIRQGLSDEFLKIIFCYSTRQAVSMAISTVRKSLLQRFVRGNVGFQSITREEYIARHVTTFANEIYNPEPNTPRVIACVDGTYSYIDKSSNFRALRQSYCLHKGRIL